MKQHSFNDPHRPAGKPDGPARHARRFDRSAASARGDRPAEPAQAAFVRDEAYEATGGVAQALAAIDALIHGDALSAPHPS